MSDDAVTACFITGMAIIGVSLLYVVASLGLGLFPFYGLAVLMCLSVALVLVLGSILSNIIVDMKKKKK